MSRRTRTKVVSLIIAGAGVGVGMALFTASHSPSAGASAIALDTVAPELSSAYGIEVSDLSDVATAALPISQSVAVETALKHSSSPSPVGVTSFPVTATANQYADSQPDGSLKPRIANRAVWIVLIPAQQIPIRYGSDKTESSYTATLAVLIDATTGDFLMSATVSAQ